MKHFLKTIQPHFQAVASGGKRVEIRKNDRSYEIGDVLVLCEYDLQSNAFSGFEIEAKVTHVLRNYDEAVKPGYIALSIEVVDRRLDASKILRWRCNRCEFQRTLSSTEKQDGARVGSKMDCRMCIAGTAEVVAGVHKEAVKHDAPGLVEDCIRRAIASEYGGSFTVCDVDFADSIQKKTARVRYAVTADGGGSFTVGDVDFADSLEEIAKHAIDNGVVDPRDIRVVNAERMNLEAPSIAAEVESAMDGVEIDYRAELLSEIGDAIDKAQAILDAAFKPINDRGIWSATGSDIPVDEVRAAFEAVLRKRKTETLAHCLRVVLSYEGSVKTWSPVEQQLANAALRSCEKMSARIGDTIRYNGLYSGTFADFVSSWIEVVEHSDEYIAQEVKDR